MKRDIPDRKNLYFCVMNKDGDYYVVDAFNKGWLRSWQKNEWKKKDKKPVLNPDLWEMVTALITDKGHKVKFIWVKGHANNTENERCDQLAVTAAESSNLLIDTEYEKTANKN